MWAVFFVDTFMSNFTFVLLTLSDPFGWGWDLFGTAGMPWIQVWPSGVPWIQAGLLLIGFGLTMQSGYRRWVEVSGNRHDALRGFLPRVFPIFCDHNRNADIRDEFLDPIEPDAGGDDREMRISKSTIWSLVALAAVLIGIPLLVIVYEANRTGQSPTGYLKRVFTRMGRETGRSISASWRDRRKGDPIS